MSESDDFRKEYRDVVALLLVLMLVNSCVYWFVW
jgi:hypothetical protein